MYIYYDDKNGLPKSVCCYKNDKTAIVFYFAKEHIGCTKQNNILSEMVLRLY